MVYFVSSSLSALDQIAETRSKGRKTIWLIFFSLVTALAIYQTADVITSFFELSMEDFESEEVATGNDVSVSVCFPMNSKRLKRFEPTNETLAKFKRLNVSCDVAMPSSLCQSVLTDRERFLIGNHLERAWHIEYDTDYDIDQPERWSNRKFFNNLKFGNCITYDLTEIETILKFEHRHFDPIFVVFHQKETPPVFHSENVFRIHQLQTDFVTSTFTVSVKKVVYEEENWPFNGACVDPQTPIESFTILNQDVNKPIRYNYSFESCLDRCLYELTKSYCNCLLERSMTHTNDQLLPICSHCNKIPQSKLDNICDCKPSCKSAEISVVAENLARKSVENELYDWIAKMHLGKTGFDRKKTIAKRIEGHLNPANFEFPYEKRLTFKQALVTKKLTKHAQTHFEDVASTIGGIWGIWIGLSVTVLFAFLIKILPKIEIDFATEYTATKTTSLANVMHLLGVAAITTVFFWQMFDTIHDYYQYKVIQVQFTENQDNASFPSVYICSNSRIFVDADKLKGQDAIMNKLQVLERVEHKEIFFRTYVHNFNEEEKLLLSPTVKDFVRQCEIVADGGKAFPCKPREIHFLVRPTPTVCAIIHPIDSAKQLTTKEIKLELQVPRSQLFYGSEHFLTVGLDPLSMVNVFQTNNFYQVEVSPGDLVKIKYSLTEIRKLPEPYVSNCIDERKKYDMWPPEIEEAGTLFNYSYTYSDCMRLCLGRLQHKPITTDSFYEYLDYENDLQKQMFGMSFNALSICQCKQPCKNKIYNIKTDQMFNVFKNKRELANITDVNKLLDILWKGRSVVRVQRESSQMTVLSEKPKTLSESLVGTIGGISGIWIGQSLLNFGVELQLFFVVTFTKIKQYFSLTFDL